MLAGVLALAIEIRGLLQSYLCFFPHFEMYVTTAELSLSKRQKILKHPIVCVVGILKVPRGWGEGVGVGEGLGGDFSHVASLNA